MNILWLTTDRSKRVAQLFTPLQDAVDHLSNVSVYFVHVGAWTRKDVAQGRTVEMPITVKEAIDYDVVFTDAYFAFADPAWWSEVSKHSLTCMLMEDQHDAQVAEYMEKARRSDFYAFFTRYLGPVERFHPWMCAERIFHLPHCFDPYIFNDNPDSPRASCLFTGSIGNIYPTRNKIVEELTGDPQFIRQKRPLEFAEQRWPTGRDYACMLANAKLSFATASVYQYVVAKYFEIPACGTALMAESLPELERLGFEPYKNYIPLLPGPVRPQMDAWLRNEQERLAIAHAGHEMVHSFHTAQVRAGEFLTQLEKWTDASSTRDDRSDKAAVI